MNHNPLLDFICEDNLLLDQPLLHTIAMVSLELNIGGLRLLIDMNTGGAVKLLFHGSGNALHIKIVVEALDQGNAAGPRLLEADMNLTLRGRHIQGIQ